MTQLGPWTEDQVNEFVDFLSSAMVITVAADIARIKMPMTDKVWAEGLVTKSFAFGLMIACTHPEWAIHYHNMLLSVTDEPEKLARGFQAIIDMMPIKISDSIDDEDGREERDS